MKNIWVLLIGWIIIFIISGGLSYITEGKMNWITPIGVAIGFSIIYFMSKSC